MEIREICESDFSAICSLINNELGYPEVNLDGLITRIELMNQDENYNTFVALLNNKIVGFIGTFQGIAFESNGFYIRIIALAVSKENQNKGIGRSLVKHVENYAKEKGITAFALNSGLQRLNTHIFYENNGYIKKSYGFSKDIFI